MRNQGTRESLDYWRLLEAPGQVNASHCVFDLIFENDYQRAQFCKDVGRCKSNDLGRDAPSRANASFANAQEA